MRAKCGSFWNSMEMEPAWDLYRDLKQVGCSQHSYHTAGPVYPFAVPASEFFTVTYICAVLLQRKGKDNCGITAGILSVRWILCVAQGFQAEGAHVSLCHQCTEIKSVCVTRELGMWITTVWIFLLHSSRPDITMASRALLQWKKKPLNPKYHIFFLVYTQASRCYRAKGKCVKGWVSLKRMKKRDN